MKKIHLLTCLLVSGFISQHAIATTQIMANNRFQAQAWVSGDPQDLVSIIKADDTGTYSVQLSVDISSRAGINIKNCGSVTHLYPNSVVLCTLSTAGTNITFSSDRNNTLAKGMYQIETANR